MSTVPQSATGEQSIPTLGRSRSVVMGSNGSLSVLFRLIGAELYKLRRRRMSKILAIITLLTVIIAFALIALAALAYSSSGTLHLPLSLFVVGQIIDYLGLVLIIIVAGTIVGGEYGMGTIRLMFTRGPSRTQFFFSKLGTILITIVLSTVVLVAIGVGLGALLNLTTGIGTDFNFFTGAWVLHALLFVLVIMLHLFMFATLAACLSILGRATVAGVAGAFIWWALEGLLAGLLPLIASLSNGLLGNVLKAVPDYFIGNSVSALLQHQETSAFGDGFVQQLQITDVHAIIVLAVYLIIFIGITWWVNKQRDVTN